MTVETEEALMGPKAKSETEDLARELGALSKQMGSSAVPTTITAAAR